MIVRRHSSFYNFTGDTSTGVTVHWGNRLTQNPTRAPWPELADISISNQCSKGCLFCYKDSTPEGKIMSVEEYRFVLDSLQSPRWGNVFQVALGGGEPLEHPQFREIIQATVDKGIVANFTTNGLLLNDETIQFLKGKIGALAISVTNFEELDKPLLKKLKQEGIKANLHFILSSQSIAQATRLLKGAYNKEVENVSNIVFLTYKPAGRAEARLVLKENDTFHQFISQVSSTQCPVGIGFDACFVPILLRHTTVNINVIDACECGFFSVYIDENLQVKPCSFANNKQFTYSLNQYNMEQIWNDKYEAYRQLIMSSNNCQANCSAQDLCKGHCHFFPEITVCYQK